ncbi:formate dehydrogenase [Campylobacter pinnipediorum subsp. pinnipediorum]|uniref:Formate dehydrogenase n=3 Tax=Campylobacter TaxID=194 RepID=A0AAX0L9G2_9BACT|nr:formate dehydrogenase [Campylobacter pinnipediorum subsp. pinnipediorum]
MDNSRVGRRSFLKLAALGTGSVACFGNENETLQKGKEKAIPNPYEGSKTVRTICSICSAGCGIEAEVKDGVWVRQDMAIHHPISQGSHCCKGIDQIDLTKSKQRIKYPMKKVDGKWQRISWETAVNEIGDKMLEIRKEHGPDCVEFLGSAKFNNEQSWYFRKFAAFWGTNNIDHVARI